MSEGLNPRTGDPRQGIRVASDLVSVTVALTTTTVFLITPGRTAIIRKLIITNRNAASGFLVLGDGDFTQRLPRIWIPAGLTTVLEEEEIPRYEFRSRAGATNDITAQSTVAAVAPNNIEVMAEVEEFAEQ